MVVKINLLGAVIEREEGGYRWETEKERGINREKGREKEGGKGLETNWGGGEYRHTNRQ